MKFNFTPFRSNPPEGMRVMEANQDHLWLIRRRSPFDSTEHFIVRKTGARQFVLYRTTPALGPIYSAAMICQSRNIFMTNEDVAPLLRMLGYGRP